MLRLGGVARFHQPGTEFRIRLKRKLQENGEEKAVENSD